MSVLPAHGAEERFEIKEDPRVPIPAQCKLPAAERPAGLFALSYQ